ncbi:MAG: hypothetical protein ACOC95_06455 [Planctomycetota bacterium]
MTLALDWQPALILLVVLAGALALLWLGRVVLQWWKLRKDRIPLPFGTLLRLRWRGVPVGKIAAAHWLATALGYQIPVDIWVGLTMLHVDVTRLAKALAVADKYNLDTAIGTLSAAAMAGYDPTDVVRTAHERGLTELTAEHLNDLDQWNLTREGGAAPRD